MKNSVNANLFAVAGTSICIGKLIEQELHRQGRTVVWLSHQIHCQRRNMYDIFSRVSIDTLLLYRVSLALGVDFFADYSRELERVMQEAGNESE